MADCLFVGIEARHQPAADQDSVAVDLVVIGIAGGDVVDISTGEVRQEPVPEDMQVGETLEVPVALVPLQAAQFVQRHFRERRQLAFDVGVHAYLGTLATLHS